VVGLRRQGFESGTTGSALSTTNPPTSGGDTAAGAVSVTGSATATVVASTSLNGTKCLETAQTTTAASDAYFRWTPYATAIGSIRFSFMLVGAVPVSGTQAIFRSFANNSARWLTISINSTGRLVVTKNSTDTIVYTSASPLLPDTKYGVQVQFSNFGSASTVMSFRLYADDFTTPVDAGYDTAAGGTGAGTAVVDVRFGRSAGTSVNTMRFDDFAFDDTTSVPIGPVNVTRHGTAAGTFAWAGAASGHAPSSQPHGTAAGTFAWTSTASGHATAPDPTKVAVMGDSLVWQKGFGATDIPVAMQAAGWDPAKIYIDGLGSRAIWEFHGATPYMRAAINSMRASGFEPKTFVIDLGTNNTGFLVSDTMNDFRALMAFIGPGHVVHFVGLGYQDQTECQVQYNPAAALGARWSEKNTVAGRPNAALLNIVEQGTNPATEPTVYYHSWNDYPPLRAAGAGPWDSTDTSSPNGTSRHNTRAGYQNYRNVYFAQVSVDARHGSATGSTTWTGTATGHTTKHGTAVGSTTWAGAAHGHRAARGTASGTTSWTGTARGHRTPRGTATGQTTWKATATGHAPALGVPTGTAAGTYAWDGAASGHAPALEHRSGVAVGTFHWTGLAHGRGQPPRDLTLTYAIGADRWTATVGHDRWAAHVGGDRWTSTTRSEP
jgi:hypothetical protein